jgi:hypothetical protein
MKNAGFRAVDSLIMFAVCLFVQAVLLPLWGPGGSVLAQLERRPVVTDRPVELTFMAPRNINLYTVENLSGGELHYSIMHTFGEVNTGISTLYGLDAGANIRFSIEYGFTDRFSAGIGRSSQDKFVDIHFRYHLLRQMQSGSAPVSVSFSGSTGVNTSEYGFIEQQGREGYSFYDRLGFSAALLVARKFNDRLSLQLSPTVVSFNRVGPETSVADPSVNTYFSVGLAGRYKVASRTAVSLQYIPAITPDAGNLTDNLAVGIDIETGGHVFQMFFTTSRALNDPYLIAGRNGDFLDREFRFGFNVNRLFRVR